MFTFLDTFLDRITMYKLVFYELIGLLVIASVLGFFGILPYSPIAIFFSTSIILIVSLITNAVFAKVFEAPTNSESVYITAFILALIITPIRNFHDIPMLFWSGVLAMSSKYILALHKKHLFNPVAIAVALTALWLGDSASWWVGTSALMPFIFLFGLAIVRKIRREDMLFVFFLTAIITEILFTFLHAGDVYTTLKTLIFNSSLLFFGFVMVTEPLTTPPTKGLQLYYGGLVGFLFSPHIHLGTLYSTPELALVVGNIFSYLVSPKQKFLLHLKEKVHYGQDIMDFIFTPLTTRQDFLPGQYMEWTLPHKGVDSRGNRRYFTIASSPTEDSFHLGVKFNAQGSSFKKALSALSSQTPLLAGNLAGDFTLPKDQKTKLVFIAGGIGITPFRSMMKYCLDTNQPRPIILFYANKFASEIAFSDVLHEAEKIGIQTVYTLTETNAVPADWKGNVGRITPDMIRHYVPDFTERLFYLSGPHPMVTAYENLLKGMGVSQNHIKKDFFPGFV